MLVEVIVDRLPYVGKRGAIKDIPANQARVLISLGKVVAAKKRQAVESMVSETMAWSTTPDAVEKPRRRRQYRRRDLTAEAAEEISPSTDE